VKGLAGVVLFRGVRILVDYRPALRERSGVGEYLHELVRAYTSLPESRDDQVTLFTSSWKDRPGANLARELKAGVVDRRVPVRTLNYAWHRLEWPPVEWLAGAADVVHALHPLLIPARKAAQVVTIHDLFFMTAPERTHAEIRRDYAQLTPEHARRAHAVITPSHYTAGRVSRELGVESEAVHVCSPGAPTWRTLGRGPNIPQGGYILFLGTLEPRKNVGVLLEAYAQLLGRIQRPPRLVLAGRPTQAAAAWLDRIARQPLAGNVEHRGYVPASQRETLFAGARVLVMPSLDEGFGLPVLEAMSAGVPVIASNRGSLPEVLGDAGALVDARDVDSLCAAMLQAIQDDAHARACAERGLTRAATFSWAKTAAAVRGIYRSAIARRAAR
jgi:glycosyltransferase involved in cell wall biosynthesis